MTEMLVLMPSWEIYDTCRPELQILDQIFRNMITVLLPDIQDNYESIKRQLPKPLRKIIYFSSFDIWWVDGREDLNEISIPLQIAQRAVIVRGWQLKITLPPIQQQPQYNDNIV
ncbi:hypothetical protein TWF730_008943 [Orbilia blumenaviensis]|uniref:Uncharacterized protein n=1 Tax=Orbilia blumenaviensis TaxID=1796055 RepID=A0AAV9UZN3_9PEZI